MGNRDDEGQFTEEYADKEFLSAISGLSVASTQNIANEVDCSYDLAYRRLKSLEEEGKVEPEEVGGSFIWLAD
jgi:CTP-dependent riboflavin kinase